MANFAKYVMDAFEELTPDISDIYENTKLDYLGDWKTKQKALVTGSGALAGAIPGLHLLAIAGDVLFLMNRMSVCSFGIGAIVGYDDKRKNILEDEDFAVVLGRWCGMEDLGNAALAKTAADLSTKVGGKAVAKMLAKSACKYSGILIGKKLGGKLGAKLGAKFGAKLGGKVASGFIPFIGAGVSGGINLYFISEICREAESYYKFKSSL